MSDDHATTPEPAPPVSDPFLTPPGAAAPAPMPAPYPGQPQYAGQPGWSGQEQYQAPVQYPAQPPYPDQPQWNGQSQWNGQPQWGIEPEKQHSTLGIIGLVLGVVALGISVVLGALSAPFAIAAIVLGIIGLVRKTDRNALPLAALLTGAASFVVWIGMGIWAFMTFVTDPGAADEWFDDGTGWTDDLSDWAGAPAGATSADGTPGLGSATDPAPAGTAFEFDSSWNGEDATVWEVTVDGYIPLPESDWTSPGRCIAIVGGITATHLPDGQDVSPWLDTPDAFAIVDGETQVGNDDCDTDDLQMQGYGHLWDAEVPEGTLYLYYYPVWIPEEITGDIDALVIGDPDSDGAAYIEAVETW